MTAAARRAASGDHAAGLAGIRRAALVIGVVALAASALGGMNDPAQFFRSYLVAFIYWLSIALGCFAIAMLHHLSGGAWGLMIRRILEAASRTLPFLALMFVPLLFGLSHLYHWARPEELQADPLLQHQSAYLNPRFFAARTLLYFLIWIGFALAINRMSLRQDAGREPRLARRMQLASAPGLALYCLTATFAAIDWLMSLDSHWSSSIYGFYFVGGQAVSALAFVILVTLFLSRRPPLQDVLRPVHFHDYGKLLLTFVVLWAYFAVSQLIIIWQGNLAEEITWYQGRLQGGWSGVSIFLAAAHFGLPFLLLLSRDLKRDVGRLASIAALLLVMRWVDLFWLAAPAFSPYRVRIHWLDLALPVALGGLWVAAFVTELGKRSLLPLHDPALAEARAHG